MQVGPGKPEGPDAKPGPPLPRAREAATDPGDPHLAGKATQGAPASWPLVQRKDFPRGQFRPVASSRGAYSLEQSGTDRLFILAGSAIGARHDQAGTRREDDVAFCAAPAAADTVVAAVADGVSNARQSHLASTLATRLAVNLLSSSLTAPAQVSALERWPQAADWLVAEVSDELDHAIAAARFPAVGAIGFSEEATDRRPGKPAATLAVVAVNETPEGFHASWLTVGDCDVVLIDFTTDKVRWLTRKAHRGGPRTMAVPSHRQATDHGQALVADGQAVVAMTDGMAELLDAEPEHTLRALAVAHNRGSAVSDLLAALDLRLQGNHDDRSLVAIGPVSQR